MDPSAVSAAIVVVKRPRVGPFAAVRSVPVWLRALTGPGPRSRPVAHAAPASTLTPTTAPASWPAPTPAGPVAASGRGALAAFVGERGGVLEEATTVVEGECVRGAADGGEGGSAQTALVVLPATLAPALLRGLRDDPALGFDVLEDLTVVDRLPGAPRFEIVYFLRASASGDGLRVRAPIEAEPPEVDSIASIWPSADWLEREAKDLFGVRFRGHPALRPLLLPADFAGAPLRRDFDGGAGEGDRP